MKKLIFGLLILLSFSATAQKKNLITNKGEIVPQEKYDSAAVRNLINTKAAVTDTAALLRKAANLADLPNKGTARTNLGVPAGSGTSTGNNTGDQVNVNGNAGTASALQTGRYINSVYFDGTQNIAVTESGSGINVANTFVNLGGPLYKDAIIDDADLYKFQIGSSGRHFFIDHASHLYGFGDVDNTYNGTNLLIDDEGKIVNITANAAVEINMNSKGGIFTAGDKDNINNGTKIYLDDAENKIEIVQHGANLQRMQGQSWWVGDPDGNSDNHWLQFYEPDGYFYIKDGSLNSASNGYVWKLLDNETGRGYWGEPGGGGSSVYVDGTTITGNGTAGNPLVRTAVNLSNSVSNILPVSNGGTGVSSLGSGIATWWQNPSSANLANAITNETGTGVAVFNTSPLLTTPRLASVSTPGYVWTATDVNGNGSFQAAVGQGSSVSSGIYFPNLGARTNINASSNLTHIYIKIGTMVTVYGTMAITPTSAGLCTAYISLPFPSSTYGYELSIFGHGVISGAFGSVYSPNNVTVISNGTNGATVKVIAPGTAEIYLIYSFIYTASS